MLRLVPVFAILALAACQPTTSGQGAGSSATTGGSAQFDFTPPEDLAARLPRIGRLGSVTAYGNRLAANISRSEAANVCSWVRGENFPRPQQTIVTYASEAEAASPTGGNRMPNAGNDTFRQGAFYARRAASSVLGAGAGSDEARIFADALRANASAGAGLDASRFERGYSFTPDVDGMLEDASAWTFSYLLVADDLPLSPAERAQVEGWLTDLTRTWSEGSRSWRNRDGLRARWLNGLADASYAMLSGDAERFDAAAREMLAVISATRLDGSSRFGASRGNRALYYQGVSLDMALETAILLEAVGAEGLDLILPTARRMAGFYVRAWQDDDVIAPYAAEQNAVVTGSDYRVQERDRVVGTADLMVALAPGDPAIAALPGIRRSVVPWPTHYSTIFNATCIGAAQR
ncbi:alginate lyase family protein [Pontivivens insulae]|uniref:Alginate lyase domain-containing protein n=1 Tax=Pontivivens insulae TaxID=1639689 RepID=A0A2R8AFF7_9RHOB|nr:alginate lyase family protein [Pontivivens insulae]RED12049.1 alginate lyase [Pontivivens insulae]SPF30805.1 hypothetical protein POI8812_03149 [Pontivivens insulae]